jgi:hypothetical protein
MPSTRTQLKYCVKCTQRFTVTRLTPTRPSPSLHLPQLALTQREDKGVKYRYRIALLLLA